MEHQIEQQNLKNQLKQQKEKDELHHIKNEELKGLNRRISKENKSLKMEIKHLKFNIVEDQDKNSDTESILDEKDHNAQ